MPRLINPLFQFRDKQGNVLRNGKITFFTNVSGSTTKQDTYADNAQSQVNTNPVILSADGFAGNVYGSLEYSVRVEDKDGVLVFGGNLLDIVPVGGDSSGAAFDDWNSTVSYEANNSIVVAGDGNYYRARQNSMGVNPVLDTDSEFWIQVRFNERWSEFETYSQWDIVYGSDNQQYQSLVNSNINNDPVGNNGSQWELFNTNQWSTGRNYIAGDVRVGSNGRWYKAVINNSGNDPVSDDGTNWLLSQGEVDTPSNVLPANGATSVARMPTLTTSAFSVSGGSDTHEYSIYQLSDDGFSTIAYDSGLQNTDLTSHTAPIALSGATEFSYRARHKGVFTGLSDWSTVTTFTTTFALDSLFDSRVFTGTATARTEVTGINLSTDSGAVMITNTSTTDPMKVVDTIRGVGNAISVGVDAFEVSEPTGVTSFNSDGYSLGAGTAYNGSGNSIFGINLGVAESFFDIVSYGGTGIARTVGHNLNDEVGAVIIFPRSGTAIGSTPWRLTWIRQMSSIQYFNFGDFNPVSSSSGAWNATTPTTTNFSLGNFTQVNQSGTNYVAYVFAHNPAAGIFCGTYTGTGTSGNKITTGFPVKTFITKSQGSTEWFVADKDLTTANHIDLDSTAQSVAGGPQSFDSDGITLNSDLGSNQSGQQYWFIAIADPSLF